MPKLEIDTVIQTYLHVFLNLLKAHMKNENCLRTCYKDTQHEDASLDQDSNTYL